MGAATIDAGRGGASGVGILMTDSTLDTGKGNDVIRGTVLNSEFDTGLLNNGSTFITGDGNDIIIGESAKGGRGIVNDGLMDTGNGNDSITGTDINDFEFQAMGIANSKDVTTGDGEDYISGTSNRDGIFNSGTINTDNGADNIFGNGFYRYGIFNSGSINTGNGPDNIFGIGGDYGYGIFNSGSINTGNDPDFIRFSEFLYNTGNIFLGEGNDSLSSQSSFGDGIKNYNFIGTGDGNDIITINGIIDNQGVIETGNGDDIITGIIPYGIYNNGGAINMGDGNDSIIADEGFKSDPNSSESVFLGDGQDYIKGYGSGDFYGGNGNDILELTPGTYTVGIGGEGDTSVIFTKGNSLMITSEFEQLIAGGTTYNFASLTAGQIIVVA
jgi:hypothetical protein